MSEKDFDFADTTYVRDVEGRVFQAIVAKCLSEIEGIGLIGGNLIDTILGREETVKGVHIEQDELNHSVAIKLEVNIAYGIPIPDKAEEIQERITKDVAKLTGLHVSCVHVIFKGLVPEEIEELEESLAT